MGLGTTAYSLHAYMPCPCQACRRLPPNPTRLRSGAARALLERQHGAAPQVGADHVQGGGGAVNSRRVKMNSEGPGADDARGRVHVEGAAHVWHAHARPVYLLPRQRHMYSRPTANYIPVCHAGKNPATQSSWAGSREVAVGVLCGINGATIQVVVPQAAARQRHLWRGRGKMECTHVGKAMGMADLLYHRPPPGGRPKQLPTTQSKNPWQAVIAAAANAAQCHKPDQVSGKSSACTPGPPWRPCPAQGPPAARGLQPAWGATTHLSWHNMAETTAAAAPAGQLRLPLYGSTRTA